jgi:hypothetical protein
MKDGFGICIWPGCRQSASIGLLCPVHLAQVFQILIVILAQWLKSFGPRLAGVAVRWRQPRATA